jgi:hypothetical protein
MAEKKSDARFLIRFGKTKTDPITVISTIPGNLDSYEDPIKLSIRASPEDWNNLSHLGYADSERLGRAIFLNFAQPIQDKSTAMGTRESRSAFMGDSRRYVAAHYARTPSRRWPDHFRELLTQLDDCPIRNPKSRHLVASRIAHWAWKREFELDDKRDRLKKHLLTGIPT